MGWSNTCCAFLIGRKIVYMEATREEQGIPATHKISSPGSQSWEEKFPQLQAVKTSGIVASDTEAAGDPGVHLKVWQTNLLILPAPGSFGGPRHIQQGNGLSGIWAGLGDGFFPDRSSCAGTFPITGQAAISAWSALFAPPW